MGYNPFLGDSPEASRENICTMDLPQWKAYRSDMESALVQILERCLERDREQRYQRAPELMIDLERVLYSKGYGPTNEKLASYMRSLYKNGQAYEDDLSDQPVSIALNPEPPNE